MQDWLVKGHVGAELVGEGPVSAELVGRDPVGLTEQVLSDITSKQNWFDGTERVSAVINHIAWRTTGRANSFSRSFPCRIRQHRPNTSHHSGDIGWICREMKLQ